MSLPSSTFRRIEHEVDVCIVGGGMAGLTAAIAAARHGAGVILMHDRPMLGGNASSEVRVHVCGADRHNRIPNMRETGILEEIRMENLHRNPRSSWGLWDTLLYEKTHYQDNLQLLLNCSCLDAETDDGRLTSITGWQLTTYTVHQVRAKIFIDASGDGILAPLTGAEHRIGREGRDEYNEPGAPPEADRKTMGMSICYQLRKCDSPQPFDPPEWACRFESCDDLPCGHPLQDCGYWWIETGGEQDSIHDTEQLRDELLKIAFGVWDHIKNYCPKTKADAAEYILEWVEFVPGKRESVRYVGQHVLTQNDILGEGRFEDTVAYGGWTMDEHPPHGFWGKKQGSDMPSAVHHKTPSPYGIPYRSLYSRTIDNLMCVGRCHSATHLGMSSTRVMGTGCSMGQAAGTAAAVATEQGLQPHEVLEQVDRLQQMLLYDDAYLPWVPQEFNHATLSADLDASTGNPEPVRDGTNRPVDDDAHAWQHAPGDSLTMSWSTPQQINQVTLIADTALHKDPQMSWHHMLNGKPKAALDHMPEEMPRSFRVQVRTDGEWQTVFETQENCRRLIRTRVEREVSAVRYTLRGTWGECDKTNLYAMYVE